MAVTDEPAPPHLGRWLQRHHEHLIRNSLTLIVEQSSLEELGARPLGAWIAELRERLTAERPDHPAREAGRAGSGEPASEAIRDPEPPRQAAAEHSRSPAEPLAADAPAETAVAHSPAEHEAVAYRPPGHSLRPRSGELAAALGLRPLGPRGAESFASAVERRAALEQTLARQLAERTPSQRPFTLGLLHPGERSAESGDPAAPPEGWTEAIRAAAEDERAVLDAGFGVTAVLLPRSGPLGARATLDALRVAAWRRLGERGPLPEAGLATFPDDGGSAEAIVACALERLARNTDATLGAPDEG